MGVIEQITKKSNSVIKVGATDDTLMHQVNRVYCVIFLVVMAIFVSSKQYVGEPIHCFCPGTFKSSHIRYANAYCWVKNTYKAPFERPIPDETKEREEQEIRYYQWVPLILVLQACMFYLPRMLWKHLNGYSGINIKRAILLANDATYLSPRKREEKINCIASFIDKWIQIRDVVSSNHRRIQNLGYKFQQKGIHRGKYLSVLYLLITLLYTMNSYGQFFFLNLILGNDFIHLGPDVLHGMVTKQAWEDLQRFPRVTFCDFDIRQLQNIQTWTIQCSLPINLFNEKVFTFMWFVLIFVSFVNTIGLIYGIFTFCLPWRSLEYVRKYLSYGRNPGNRGQSVQKFVQTESRFVDDYLRHDGVFMIYLISHHASPVIGAEVAVKLWTMYTATPQIEEFLKADDVDPS